VKGSAAGHENLWMTGSLEAIKFARHVRFPAWAKQHGLVGEGRGLKVELWHGQARRSATTRRHVPPGWVYRESLKLCFVAF